MNQTKNDGEKMERKMWEDIEAKNWKAVEGKIAEGFQSVHPDGARDRAGEISLIKNLNAGKTALSDFKSTTNGDSIVVIYMISAQETIDLERIADETRTAAKCLEKSGKRLAMDLPCQPNAHSVANTRLRSPPAPTSLGRDFRWKRPEEQQCYLKSDRPALTW